MKHPVIHGFPVDEQTRCVHYHSALDVIAIRFRCCDTYYPCIHCHEESAGHAVERWPERDWDARAILCGVCRHQLSITEYFNCGYTCPLCGAAFNPRCSNHDHLYFEVSTDPRAGEL
ncbi:MAG: hypothetical protein EOO08_11200 [Chitinophagaceae bacterium]|nr:MAG: hypothetical protein EOO08_11200 [Chitinophagaceae bacterium]